jgi:hypothetical protein
MELPSRVADPASAETRYGDRFRRLAPALWREDPLGDAAAAAVRRDGAGAWEAALAGQATAGPLRELVDSVGALPSGWSPAAADRAGRLFFRTGPVGGLVLGARSLVAGYCSPAGNKPLTRTGALQRDGQRRLAETGRFVVEVHREGGMHPGAAGWAITLRVRMMHAMVRGLLHQGGAWDAARWGAPLNQHDLLATALLFSVVWVDGVRLMGARVTAQEAEDHLHLWRWVGRVIGVEEALLPADVADGEATAAMIFDTQGEPDDDARALVDALLRPDPTKGRAPLGEGLCRALMGDPTADALGLRRTPWRHLPRCTRLALRPLESARRRSARLERGLVSVGERYWEAAIAAGLGADQARFTPPERLRSP